MSEPIQAIDASGNFVLPTTWGSPDFCHLGLFYHVVGVFGAQSSGKSTLLNALFGTTFPTLTDSSVRCRTTDGAYLSTAEDDGGILLLDFEGTDGSERGDDSTFERQLCLFALSVADILLINMWSTDVGRFNAANLSLLRTVFEVRLQLSSHECSNTVPRRVTLLFVIRDHSGDVERAGEKILSDLTKLWRGMHKPAEFADKGIHDFFDPQCVALPHFEFQRPQFNQAVATLRRRFVVGGPSSFMTSDKMLHDVPAEALWNYMRQCWETIRSNKDLDLPTQRQMIAEYRCTALCALIRQQFDERCAEEAAGLSSETRLSVRLTLQEDMSSNFAKFSAATQLYAPNVVAKFRDDLEASMYASTRKVFDRQVQLIAAGYVRSLEHLLSGVIEDATGLIVTAAHTPTQTDSKKMVDSFWARVTSQGAKVVGRWSSYLENRGALADDELRTAVVHRVDGDARVFLRRIFEAAAADVNGTMNRVFERVLKHDPSGIPRSFRSEKQLKGAIGPARYGGYLTLACFQRWRIVDSWEPQPQAYLEVPAECAVDEGTTPTESRVADDDAALVSTASLPHIIALYRQHAQHAYELHCSLIQGGAHVPLWMWVLLAVFGYDELWYVLTNPVLIIALGVFVYIFCHQAVVGAFGRAKATAPPGVMAIMTVAERFVLSLLPPPEPEKPKRD